MSTHDNAFSLAHSTPGRDLRIRSHDRNRWLLFALVVFAFVPMDADGPWATTGVLAAAALLVAARHVLRHASAKVDAALADELGPPVEY